MNNHLILHTNTEYSFLSSTIRIESLFKLVKEKKLSVIALTDKENLFALPMFLKFSQDNNLKLLIGIELNLSEGFTVMVYAKNYLGYTKLNEFILVRSEKKEISFYELENENLLVVNHFENGLKNNFQGKIIKNFYFNDLNTVQNWPTVYAPTKKILNKNDNEILSVLNNIAQNPNDNNYYNDYYDPDEFNYVSQDVLKQMNDFVELIEPIEISSEIKIMSFKNKEEQLKKSINKIKYQKLIKKYGKNIIDTRIKYEFDTIKKLGFIDYFLIIKDILDYGRTQKIEIGPGRGSSSGSIIAFLLDITNVNPIEYGLLFERFLNVARVSLPDIDIDIQDDRRNEIIDYIGKRFGKENCALISTFQTLASKSSLRDVGRVLKIPLSYIDKVTTSLNAVDSSLEIAYAKNTKYKLLVNKYPKLHEYASKIEGLPRQSGIHAAGVIICNQRLTNIIPVRANSYSLNQVEFEMTNLEQFGLIKIDFLGLKNLTIIQQIESQLQEQFQFDQVIDLNFNPFNDKITFDLINTLNTDGIFQLESPGMRNVIQTVHVDTFEDIYAIISLFRPGPKEFIPDYANVKFAKQIIHKIHPIYDKIVASTFGIIVYQEQIMEIAQQVAKMSFVEADLLRRAISKKNVADMNRYRELFYQNGLRNNINLQTLELIYNQIEKFALYGFNKAHAVAYSFIAYKLAFYKARYPEIFYKVIIDNSISDLSAIKKISLVAKKHNIEVYSPKINNSYFKSEILWKTNQENSKIQLPLIVIKGIGAVAVEKIYNEIKTHGKIDNFFTGVLRLRIASIGYSVIETLIKANVFREFGNITELLDALLTIENGYKVYKKIHDKSNKSIQEKLEKFYSDTDFPNKKINAKNLDLDLEIKCEKEFLGAIYNAFPTKKYEKKITLGTLKPSQNEFLYVFLESVKKNIKGKIIARVSDSTNSVDAFIFNTYAQDLIDYKNPRIILINISFSEKGYYIINSWQEVINE
ncbi:DNA polymerase III subunit alpha [Mycoplasmopsis cricetuli]|uniref:DNA polymerase III subunit alpha n=1 Tax=Mycoplasmopsis cricetuli TaxID=171283 RepID=UPI00046F928E|nr:DNA polymerase III subunit alpha [Mycoplasmopsis cricetuli]